MKPIFCLLFTVALWAQSPVQQAMDYMAVTAKDNAFMGTVLVAKDGKTLFSNGYGFANAEHGVLNAIETKFRLGSYIDQVVVIAERSSLNGDDADQYRKLAYVALTRAKKAAALLKF